MGGGNDSEDDDDDDEEVNADKIPKSPGRDDKHRRIDQCLRRLLITARLVS